MSLGAWVWRFRMAWLVGALLGLGLAPAAAPSVARVGSRSIDAATFSLRAGRLAPFQRARFGATWPEQRRQLLERELVRDALFEIEASAQDSSLGSARDNALARALLLQLEQGVQSAGVPNEQIASYYAEHRQSYELPRSILIWRILLRQEADARALLHELGTPQESTWSRLARERSIDTATHMRSGSLGYVAQDGQTHMPQVRVSPALFAAAERVHDGEIVPQPVAEGDAYAVVWRRGSRAAQPSQLAAVSEDIGALLGAAKLASKAQTLIERLRRESVRDYQPGPLAGFEPRSSDALGSRAAPLAKTPPMRPVTLTPRATDSGLR
jgi:peptidyl-prolyl cis-trans isomerase C